MPQAVFKIRVHLIFSTKNRVPSIQPPASQELHKYLGGILSHYESTPIRVGGPTDHVHLFFLHGRKLAFCDLVEELKKTSSKWMKTMGVPDFYWQNGYGGFEVRCDDEPLIAYIENQVEHHRKQSFQDEYRAFLKEHGVKYDERYVWE
jgi:putative transposase